MRCALCHSESHEPWGARYRICTHCGYTWLVKEGE